MQCLPVRCEVLHLADGGFLEEEFPETVADFDALLSEVVIEISIQSLPLPIEVSEEKGPAVEFDHPLDHFIERCAFDHDKCVHKTDLFEGASVILAFDHDDSIIIHVTCRLINGVELLLGFRCRVHRSDRFITVDKSSHSMLDIATCLRYYKRKDVQEAIVGNARGRELAVKYGDNGFGKRPDLLTYPAEVLEFAKKGVTSFHVSEERWSDPLQLAPGMKRKDLDALREGWDLVIDIDSTHWGISRAATALIVRSLREMDIHSISVKFSGNKGFHIGVPWECFPEEVLRIPAKQQFPDLPKRVASFLVDYINDTHISVHDNVIQFGDIASFPYEELQQMIGAKELVSTVCKGCKDKRGEEKDEGFSFVCPMCQAKVDGEYEDYRTCERCNVFMERISQRKSASCSCGAEDWVTKLNPLAIIDVDTLLISSRHMYRCAYSLHEKSGLASVCISPDDVMSFDKEQAKPDNVKVQHHFFSGCRDNEAAHFFRRALDHKMQRHFDDVARDTTEVQHEDLSEAAPRELFPPCIHNILKGTEDGRKRSMFVLLGFLKHAGWSYDQVETLMNEWNENNEEPLREGMLQSHLRYHKDKKTLPPNCSNEGYYKALQVCDPDGLCARIKNPVNYVRRKMYAYQQNGEKRTGAKKGAEQEDDHKSDQGGKEREGA